MAGIEVDSRPMFWTNTVCMGACWMPLSPSSHPTTSHMLRQSSPTLENWGKKNKNKPKNNTARNLFMLSFQKSRKCNAARRYKICASWSNFGGAAIGSHMPCFVETCQEKISWRIQDGRLWSLLLEWIGLWFKFYFLPVACAHAEKMILRDYSVSLQKNPTKEI